MLMRFFAAIGIPVDATRLLVNSMGCEQCRPAYRDAVKAYMDAHADELCDECKRRAEINPLRAFDCKNPDCAAVMADAPKITEHLCDDCREHYDTVKAYLGGAGLSFEEDPKLVRGLDYYTRTVFEVQVTEGMGSQNAIGGGGRYDKLAEEVGGRPTPGFGFALGYERCALALQAAGYEFPAARRCDFFVACVDDSVRAEAFSLVQACRDAGLIGEMDHQHEEPVQAGRQAGRRRRGGAGSRRAGRRPGEGAQHADAPGERGGSRRAEEAAGAFRRRAVRRRGGFPRGYAGQAGSPIAVSVREGR